MKIGMARIAQRCAVSPEFKSLLQRQAAWGYKRLAGEAQFNVTFQAILPSVRAMFDPRRTGPNLGLEYELTRLRNSRYRKAGVLHNGALDYFTLESQDVYFGNRNFGAYLVLVPALTTEMRRIEFVPVRNPLRYARHPHHRSNVRGSSPVGGDVNTCWGSFAGPVAHFLYTCQMVDLFLVLYRFLEMYNPGDTLVNLERVWRESNENLV